MSTDDAPRSRLDYLRHHYQNERALNKTLRAALERIFRDPANAKVLASAALDAPRPPQPLRHFYDQGIHTGHPFEEYWLDLPEKDADPYSPCETCGSTTDEGCIEASTKARAKKP